jgi:hypothetical protein
MPRAPRCRHRGDCGHPATGDPRDTSLEPIRDPGSCSLHTPGAVTTDESAHVVTEPGNTCQHPFAFEQAQRPAAGLPCMSVLLAEAGN